MILRLAAALALLLGAATVLVYAQKLGKGPGAPLEARHLREMKDRLDPPDVARAVTVDAIAALPVDAPVAEYSATERRGVSLEAWVQRTVRSSDGDLHLEMVATPRLPGGPDTSYVTGEITDAWRRLRPGLTIERLLATFRPNSGGARPWPAGPRRVRISGWLLYDWQYDAVPTAYSRLRGAARLTGWEIHPVTRIEAWDDAAGGWAVVAR